jgi:hypothetical protein
MNSLTLPMILSGPIVRRAEPTQITLWIATSKWYRIHADLLRITSNKDTSLFDYSILIQKVKPIRYEWVNNCLSI